MYYIADMEEPIKDDQSLCGILKSPTKIHLLNEETRPVRYKTKEEI